MSASRSHRFIASIVVVCTVLFASEHAAFGEPTQVGEHRKLITPLKLGERAPYQGLLLSEPAVADWISEIEAQREKARLELQRQLDIQAAKATKLLDDERVGREADSRQCSIVQDSLRKDNNDLKVMLLDSRSSPGAPQGHSQSESWMWTGLGFATGAVMASGIAWAIISASSRLPHTR